MNWFTYRSYHARHRRSHRPFPGAALIRVRQPVRPVPRSVRAERRAQRAAWLHSHVARVRRSKIAGRAALAVSAAAFILTVILASVQPSNPLERAQNAQINKLVQWEAPTETIQNGFAPSPLPTLALLTR